MTTNLSFELPSRWLQNVTWFVWPAARAPRAVVIMTVSLFFKWSSGWLKYIREFPYVSGSLLPHQESTTKKQNKKEIHEGENRFLYCSAGFFRTERDFCDWRFANLMTKCFRGNTKPQNKKKRSGSVTGGSCCISVNGAIPGCLQDNGVIRRNVAKDDELPKLVEGTRNLRNRMSRTKNLSDKENKRWTCIFKAKVCNYRF